MGLLCGLNHIICCGGIDQQINLNSEKELTDKEKSDLFYDSALKLLRSLKLDSKNIIKNCSYESIGIAPIDDKTIGYYTVEADPDDKNNLYFCYVDEETGETYNKIGFEKNRFHNRRKGCCRKRRKGKGCYSYRKKKNKAGFYK